jgi:hypothetical protein
MLSIDFNLLYYCTYAYVVHYLLSFTSSFLWLPFFLSHTHTDTRIYSHINSRTYTYVHRYSHTYVYTHTHILTHTYAYMHTDTHILTYSHTHTLTHSLTNTYVLTLGCTTRLVWRVVSVEPATEGDVINKGMYPRKSPLPPQAGQTQAWLTYFMKYESWAAIYL